MKKIIKYSLIAFFTASVSALNANVTVNVVANSVTGTYQTSTDSSLAGFTYAYGFFDEAAYDLLGANQNDFASVGSIFNELGRGVLAGSGEIFSIGNSHPIPGGGAEPQPGSLLYMWVFNSAAEATATEWGIFGASAWIMPNDNGTVSLTSSQINNIVVGSTSGGNFQLALTAVPEPSTYAAIAGLLALGAVMVRRRRA